MFHAHKLTLNLEKKSLLKVPYLPLKSKFSTFIKFGQLFYPNTTLTFDQLIDSTVSLINA